MKIIPEPLVFEWNEGNRDKNLIKHDVSTREIEEVFKTRQIYIFKDERHSTEKEIRYGMFSKTEDGRLLSVVFTLRRDKIRIITARDMSRKERRIYEKIKNHS